MTPKSGYVTPAKRRVEAEEPAPVGNRAARRALKYRKRTAMAAALRDFPKRPDIWRFK